MVKFLRRRRMGRAMTTISSSYLLEANSAQSTFKCRGVGNIYRKDFEESAEILSESLQDDCRLVAKMRFARHRLHIVNTYDFPLVDEVHLVKWWVDKWQARRSRKA